MINLIIQFIFWLITTIFNIIFTPVFAAIYALFPDVAQYFTYINNFLDYAFQYVNAALDFLIIPSAAMQLLFSYIVIKYSIFLVRQTIKFTFKVFTTLKP